MSKQEYKSKLIKANYHTDLWFEANKHYGGILKGLSHNQTIYISMTRDGIAQLHAEVKKAHQQGEEYQPAVIKLYSNEYAWLKYMKPSYDEDPVKVWLVVQELSEYSGDSWRRRNIEFPIQVLMDELSELLKNVPDSPGQHEYDYSLENMVNDGYLDDKGNGIYFKNANWSPDRDDDYEEEE